MPVLVHSSFVYRVRRAEFKSCIRKETHEPTHAAHFVDVLASDATAADLSVDLTF